MLVEGHGCPTSMTIELTWHNDIESGHDRQSRTGVFAAWLLFLQQLVNSPSSADNQLVRAKLCVPTENSAYLTLLCVLQLDITLILGLLCCQQPLRRALQLLSQGVIAVTHISQLA